MISSIYTSVLPLPVTPWIRHGRSSPDRHPFSIPVTICCCAGLRVTTVPCFFIWSSGLRQLRMLSTRISSRSCMARITETVIFSFCVTVSYGRGDCSSSASKSLARAVWCLRCNSPSKAFAVVGSGFSQIRRCSFSVVFCFTGSTVFNA